MTERIEVERSYENMKCLTLNVHAWLEEKPLEKMDILANAIVKNEYDVIALQEVNQSMEAKLVYLDIKEDNFGYLLCEKINALSYKSYQYFWASSHMAYGKYDEGIALLTKWPVKHVEEFYCSQSQNYKTISARRVLELKLNYKGKYILCYSCHINLPNQEGEDQIENVKNILEHSKTDETKILLGDFNVDAIQDENQYNNIKRLGLWDTYELAKEKDDGITVSKAIDGWDKQKQNKRIDYIFVNKEVDVISSFTIFNEKNEPVVSDHYGLNTILQWRTK